MKNRKLNRLQGYDYSNSAYYFVTIRLLEGRMGEIKNNNVELNQTGNIIKSKLLSLTDKFPGMELDYYIIMPDHIHVIIIINNNNTCKSKSLSEIIGVFKLGCTQKIRLTFLPPIRWQRSFHDRIIRSEEELRNKRNYILYNAIKE
jgi:putative transposase